MKKEKEISVENRPWFKVWPRHLPKNLEYPQVPAWWIIERNMNRFADRTAIIFLNHEDLSEIERLSYSDLWQKANSLAAGLRELGIRKGDRVATLLPNSPSLIVSYYGIWMSGASITPCNAMAKEKEIEYQLKDSGARILIAADTLNELASPVTEKLGLTLIVASVGEKINNRNSKNAIPFERLIYNGRKRPTDFSIDPCEDTAVLL